jgi:DNA-binding transcriptional regulator LsrR (DeoR family)
MAIVTNLEIRKRIKMEKAIVRRFVRDALLEGYTITVGNEGNCVKCVSEARIMREAFAADECHIYIVKDNKIWGWVIFIMGNDGCDVIHDYTANKITTSLIAGAEEVARKYEDICYAKG